MKHPNETTLALHAGGDLGRIARWRTARHLANCERCREEVAAFAAMRDIAPDLSETPEVSWNRLAADMRANIRLGLAAGECVRPGEEPLRQSPLFSGARMLVAFASLMAIMVTGLMLEHPTVPPRGARYQGVVVETTADGIEVRNGGQALRLMHSGARKSAAAQGYTLDVNFSVGAQGSMRAGYVDPETGYVTINNVYAE
jgi:hypothetical protein